MRKNSLIIFLSIFCLLLYSSISFSELLSISYEEVTEDITVPSGIPPKEQDIKIVRVWEDRLMSAEMYNPSKDKNEIKFFLIRTLYDVHCTRRKIRPLYMGTKEKGETIKPFDGDKNPFENSAWQFLIPGSEQEKLFKSVCVGLEK